MPRFWPERLAKRIGRLCQNLDTMDAKGRTSDRSYSRMLDELADLCGQILDARDKAQAELTQAKTDAIFVRRKVAEEQAILRKEQEEFRQELASARASRKAEEAEHSRLQGEISRERTELAEATARAKTAERKFSDFMDTMNKAAGKL